MWEKTHVELEMWSCFPKLLSFCVIHGRFSEPLMSESETQGDHQQALHLQSRVLPVIARVGVTRIELYLYADTLKHVITRGLIYLNSCKGSSGL